MKNKESNFTALIREICGEEGITLTPYADGWVWGLAKGTTERYIFGYQFGLNLAATASVCLDKGACSEILAAHGIPCVPHTCLMSPAKMKYVSDEGAWAPAMKLLHEYGTLVVKENEGTAGEGVYLVHDELELEEAATKIFAAGRSMAVSPYIKIEEEYRIILLDGEVQVIFSKERPGFTGDGVHTLTELYLADVAAHPAHGRYGIPVGTGTNGGTSTAGGSISRIPEKGEKISYIWKHNLGQGAGAILHSEEELPEAVELAKRAFAAVGARFSSCDVVKTAEGYRILEINSGVMMENLAGTGPKERELAKSVYRKAIRLMFEMA